MRILGIDPGTKNLGWCILDNGQIESFGMGFGKLKEYLRPERHPFPTMNVVAHLFSSINIVACENYKPQPFRGGAALGVGEINERISLMAARAETPFVLQDATTVKRAYPDTDIFLFLQSQKITKRTNAHVRDAIRHALYCECQFKIGGTD